MEAPLGDVADEVWSYGRVIHERAHDRILGLRDDFIKQRKMTSADNSPSRSSVNRALEQKLGAEDGCLYLTKGRKDERADRYIAPTILLNPPLSAAASALSPAVFGFGLVDEAAAVVNAEPGAAEPGACGTAEPTAPPADGAEGVAVA